MNIQIIYRGWFWLKRVRDSMLENTRYPVGCSSERPLCTTSTQIKLLKKRLGLSFSVDAISQQQDNIESLHLYAHKKPEIIFVVVLKRVSSFLSYRVRSTQPSVHSQKITTSTDRVNENKKIVFFSDHPNT